MLTTVQRKAIASVEIPDTEQSQDLAFIKYRKYYAGCTCMCVCLNMTQSNLYIF